ncbi:hypothetical protein RB195_025298 [Necator americanus]|uniref:Uncharacterized protein n=1 Tax=Necator americanus TaxID=51031 RepID=A0ABR1ERR3_NECAM
MRNSTDLSLEGSQPASREAIAADGLPVSAESGLTQDILVSRTSVRPKTCNQGTGRCKGGGLESPPTNKLHMSTLRAQTLSPKQKAWYGGARKDGDVGVIGHRNGKGQGWRSVFITHVRDRDETKPFSYESGEELLIGTRDSRAVDGAGVFVNRSVAKNIDSFELTTQIGRLWMRRCGLTPPLTIFVAYAPTSSYEEEACYMDPEIFYREDHTF